MSEGLPGLDALAQACRAFGLNDADARLLHLRSNAVYLLPHEHFVARLAPATPLRQQRATTVIAVARWLATQPGHDRAAPLTGDQPTIAGGAVATFWPHQPTTPPSTLNELAELLRRLHALPPPPFPVPHRRREAIKLDQARHQPVLSENHRTWFTTRAHTLVSRFTTTAFPLGIGLIHADAHRENVVQYGPGCILIDWDQTCVGTRELDLLTGLPDHFHEPAADRTAFLTAYGYDLTEWPNWPMLRDIAELHSLASYIRLAPSKPAAADELDKRIRSLRTGDTTARWHAIS